MAKDDLDSLLYDDDRGNEEAVVNKKRRNAVIAVGSAVVLVGGFLGVSAIRGATAPEPPPPPPEEIAMQYVNSEQVNWADMMCASISSFSAKMDDLEEFESPRNPDRTRNAMVSTLETNAGVITSAAEDISEIPQAALDQAREDRSDILITNNISVLSDDVDEGTSRVSQRTAASMNAYAASLRDMALDLQDYAQYNANGLRAAIARVTITFEQLNADFASSIEEAFSGDIFENPVTMREVANLDTCNGAMINMDQLREEYGEELSNQEKIATLAVTNRCNSYRENLGVFGNDTGLEEDEDSDSDSSNGDSDNDSGSSNSNSDSEGDGGGSDSQEPGSNDESTQEASEAANSSSATTSSSSSSTSTTTSGDEDDDDEDSGSGSNDSEDNGNSDRQNAQLAACADYLSENTVDETDPVYDMDITFMDDRRDRGE